MVKIPILAASCNVNPGKFHLYFLNLLNHQHSNINPRDSTHTIHVWYIYLRLVDVYDKCIGKYTIHGLFGPYQPPPPPDISSRRKQKTIRANRTVLNPGVEPCRRGAAGQRLLWKAMGVFQGSCQVQAGGYP